MNPLLTQFIGIFWLLCLACSGPQTPLEKNSLIIAADIDPDNVNPLVAPYALSGYIIDLVNPGLARRTVGPNGLEYEPVLAKSWTFNETLTTLTYVLREDIVWEDGTPFTSADVAFTMELMADPDVASNWLGDTKNIKAVHTPDPHTVVFEFHEPRNPIWQQGYTFRGVLPKHRLESVDRGSLRSHESARNPLAIGPYRIKEWKRNQVLILEANPKAPADWKPKLEHIIFRIIPESQTQLLTIQTGELDMLLNVQFGDIKAIEDTPRLRPITSPSDYMIYIGYNTNHEKYQNVNTRKAFAMATDRQAIIDRIYTVGETVYARPCEATVAPNLGAWYAQDLKAIDYDPEGAAALLAEAGWMDSDGDGIREKNGEVLRIRMMMQNSNEKGRKLAILVQNQWRKVGIDLQIDALDATAFADRARKKNYDALLWSFGNNPKVDLPIIWQSDGRYNWFGYNNPEVDALLKQGVSSIDPKVAQDAFKEAQRKIHTDQPVTFLLWVDGVMALDHRFKEVQHSTFNPLFHAERWQFAAGSEPAR